MTAQILKKTLLVLLIIGVATYLYTTMPVPTPFVENKADPFIRWSVALFILLGFIVALSAPSRPSSNNKKDTA